MIDMGSYLGTEWKLKRDKNHTISDVTIVGGVKYFAEYLGVDAFLVSYNVKENGRRNNYRTVITVKAFKETYTLTSEQ